MSFNIDTYFHWAVQEAARRDLGHSLRPESSKRGDRTPSGSGRAGTAKVHDFAGWFQIGKVGFASGAATEVRSCMFTGVARLTAIPPS